MILLRQTVVKPSCEWEKHERKEGRARKQQRHRGQNTSTKPADAIGALEGTLANRRRRIISGRPLDHVAMGKRRGGRPGNQGPTGDGPGVWVAKFDSAPPLTASGETTQHAKSPSFLHHHGSSIDSTRRRQTGRRLEKNPKTAVESAATGSFRSQL